MPVLDFENMYCGLIRRGDIFLCEMDKKKEVPVLVLQDTALNDGLATVICAFIEPKHHETICIDEVMIGKHETGLGKEHVCALHKIATIERQKFIAKKGEASEGVLRDIYKALDIVCGRFRD